MKKSRLFGVVCACIFSAYITPASAVIIDYSNAAGSSIDLNPADNCGGSGTIGCFSFSTGNNIQITSGTAQGFSGEITGTFGVNPIAFGIFVQRAEVTGTGVLSIFDGSETLTAELNWVDMFSAGTAGNLNATGSANLSNILYGGVNGDLLALAGAGGGINTASFQFTSPMTLSELFNASTTVTSTSFSGSIAPVPVPAAAWLFGSGLLGLIGIARKKSA